MSTTKTPGQINYEGYYNAIDKPLTEWTKISEYYRKSWEAGAQAVIDAQPCPHPWDLVQKTVNVDGSMGWLSKSITAKCTKCGKEL